MQDYIKNLILQNSKMKKIFRNYDLLNKEQKSNFVN